MLKSLFVLKIFEFLSWFFAHIEKRPDQKDKVNFKVHDVTDWQTNKITTHILPNISRSKGIRAMKFGQLIKYNMGNIFSQKSCKEWGRENSYRSFLVF